MDVRILGQSPIAQDSASMCMAPVQDDGTATWPGSDQLKTQAKTAAIPSIAITFDNLTAAGSGLAHTRILSKNLDSWNARWDMLNDAKTSIDVSYFSFERDVFGMALLGGMLKKQKEGVKVRIMTDAMADNLGQRGFKMPLRGKDFLQELVNHGGEAYLYNPLWKRPGQVINFDYSALASNHDKLFVVDGKKGITGGRNIGIDYLTEAIDRPGAWRDMDMEFNGEGPAKGLIKALEVEIGDGTVARKIGKDDFGNWSKKDIQLIGAYRMMDLWLNDPALPDSEKAFLRKDPAARAKMAQDLVKRALDLLKFDLPDRAPNKKDLEQLNEMAAELVTQLEARGSRKTCQADRLPEHAAEVKIIDQTSAAANQRIKGMAPALKELVQSATKELVIENPYVVLTEDMMQQLEKASARGVQIKIITNSPLSTDSAVTQAFFLEDWQMVLARCPNARIFVATGDRKFHTKSAVADGEVSFVSTYNLDLLSGHVNSEVGALVKSKEVAADLKREFDQDISDPANGFLEYKIQKDAAGNAILKDGRPIPVFGPEDHLPQEILDDYAKKRKLWGQTLRNNVPYLKPLRHPVRINVQ